MNAKDFELGEKVLADMQAAHAKALSIMAEQAARIKQLELALGKVGTAIIHWDRSDLNMIAPKDGTIVQFVGKVLEDELHPDDKAVDQFVFALGQAMKAKLEKKRGEGYSQWWDKNAFPWEKLIKQMLEHIKKGDPLDVANYCMFLYHRGEKIDGTYV